MLAGAVGGLAWAAALRAFMAEFMGAQSTFDWFGTFEGILLPGAVAGGLLGWAEHLRRTGRRPTWLAAAPLVFVLATPAVVVSVFIDGLGGGAIAVPLFGMAGGYALAGRGPRWVRWAAGVVALLPVPGWLIGASLIDGHVALCTPRGAWLAVLFLSLLAVTIFDDIRELATPRGTWTVVLLSSHLAVLTLACAVPHRALATGGPRVASCPGPEGRAAGAGPEAASAGTRGVNRR